MGGEPGATATEAGDLPAERIEREVTAFLEAAVKAPVPVDHDLFATRTVSSIFAMELVVHLERTYGIAILGADLRLDNFRTVRRITELVRRLRGAPAGAAG